jgi:hypothetical protein
MLLQMVRHFVGIFSEFENYAYLTILRTFFCYLIVGSTDMTVTEVTIIRNGVSESILDLVPDVDLAPGESTTVVQTDVIDRCVAGTYETITNVDAESNGNKICVGTDQYIFEIPRTCFVDAEILCVNEDGTPCTELQPPVGICSIGDTVDVVRFTINPESCDSSSNSQDNDFVCTDTRPMPPVGTNVQVTCVDGSNIIYGPNVVQVGEAITIGSPAVGSLPDTITCTITNENGNREYQQTTINTSGEVTLLLKDTFGAFELEACEAEGVVEDCIEEITYR